MHYLFWMNKFDELSSNWIRLLFFSLKKIWFGKRLVQWFNTVQLECLKFATRCMKFYCLYPLLRPFLKWLVREQLVLFLNGWWGTTSIVYIEDLKKKKRYLEDNLLFNPHLRSKKPGKFDWPLDCDNLIIRAGKNSDRILEFRTTTNAIFYKFNPLNAISYIEWKINRNSKLLSSKK